MGSLPLLDFVEADAVLSPNGRHRYLLTRIRHWSSLPIVWIMLNPSTADATSDDMTLRRVQSYSFRWGYHRIYVVNLFGLRATDPRELLTAADPIGAANDDVIDAVLSSSTAPAGVPVPPQLKVVAAWGAWGDRFPERVEAVRELVARRRLMLWRLGPRLKGGQPRHPGRTGDELKLEVEWAHR